MLSQRFACATLIALVAIVAALSVVVATKDSAEREPNSADALPDVRWRLQSSTLRDGFEHAALLKMAERVNETTQGHFKIEVLSSGTISSGPRIYGAVQKGQVEMGMGWPNWWQGEDPAWPALNSLPFGIEDVDATLIYYLEGDGSKYANELANPDGILWRPAWVPGREMGLLTREPISGLKDLKDKNVRIGPGPGKDMFEDASGAHCLSLTMEDTRAHTDLFAAEWSNVSSTERLGIAGSYPYARVPALWQPCTLADFLINQAAFEALPARYQAALESAIAEFTLMLTMTAKLEDILAHERMVDAGLKIERWSDQDVREMYAAKERALEKRGAESEKFREILDKKEAFRKRFVNYRKYFGPYDREIPLRDEKLFYGGAND